jgi:hypothetical protein
MAAWLSLQLDDSGENQPSMAYQLKYLAYEISENVISRRMANIAVATLNKSASRRRRWQTGIILLAKRRKHFTGSIKMAKSAKRRNGVKINRRHRRAASAAIRCIMKTVMSKRRKRRRNIGEAVKYHRRPSSARNIVAAENIQQSKSASASAANRNLAKAAAKSAKTHQNKARKKKASLKISAERRKKKTSKAKNGSVKKRMAKMKESHQWRKLKIGGLAIMCVSSA